MPANGSLGRVVAISALALACAAPTLAGDRDAPVAFSVSSFFGEGAFLGVSLEEETEQAEGGARVVHVVDGSAADEAGLEVGDVIVRFDGRTIRGPRALTKAMGELEPGDEVSVAVVRDDREQTLDVELGEREGVKWLGSGGDNFNFDFALGGAFGRPLLGVQLVHVTEELRRHLGGDDDAGVLVSKIVSGSAAEDAGIEVGDLIVAVDGESVESANDIQRALQSRRGETFAVEVVRDGRSMAIDVSIADRNDDDGSGPRAMYFAPDADGLRGQIDEILEHVRQTLGDVDHGAIQLETREALQEALGAQKEVMRQATEVRQEALERAREALQRSRESQNLL